MFKPQINVSYKSPTGNVTKSVFDRLTSTSPRSTKNESLSSFYLAQSDPRKSRNSILKNLSEPASKKCRSQDAIKKRMMRKRSFNEVRSTSAFRDIKPVR